MLSHGKQTMMTKRQREKDERLREQAVSCCTSDEDDEEDPVPNKRRKAEVETQGEASSSTAAASSSTAADREIEKLASTAYAAPPGSRSPSVISVESADPSRPPSAASSSAPSRPLSAVPSVDSNNVPQCAPTAKKAGKSKLVPAGEDKAAERAAARAAANKRFERASSAAREAREQAGLLACRPPIQLDDDGGGGAAVAEPDDLVELLEVLYESIELGDKTRHPFTKAPFFGVSNAAALAELLKTDARWFDETASKPISVAKREGGKMTQERLLDLISEPEGGSSSDSDIGGGRPAQVMRSAPASRHWKLGELDDKNMTLEKLDTLMRNSSDAAGITKIKSSVTRSDRSGDRTKTYTVAEWDKLPETERRAGELDKLLHWPVSESPLKELKLPDFIDDINWCKGAPRQHNTFSTKLQLVHDNHQTGWHFDNEGCDTWMKLLQGKVFVATCSFADAKAHGLEEWDAPMQWRILRECASARLFVMRKGDVFLMPAGTYHYVYTIKKKLVVAGDILNASGWRTRVQSIECFREDKKHETDMVNLVNLFKHGVVNIEQSRAQQWLDERAVLSPVRHRYVGSVLEWARALQLEGGSRPKVDKVMRSKELQEALQAILDCYDRCSPTPAPSHHELWQPEPPAEPPVEPPVEPPAEPPTVAASQPEPLDQLVAMGFVRESAEAALAGNDGDVLMAADMLAASASDEAAAVAAASAPPSQPGPSHQPRPPSLETPPSDAGAPPRAPAPAVAPVPSAAPVAAAVAPALKPSYPVAVGERVIIRTEKTENAHVNGITVEIVEVLEGRKYKARALTGQYADSNRTLVVQHRMLELPLAPAAGLDSPE